MFRRQHFRVRHPRQHEAFQIAIDKKALQRGKWLAVRGYAYLITGRVVARRPDRQAGDFAAAMQDCLGR